MHETTKHAIVSDALAAFACSPLSAASVPAVNAAGLQVAAARAHRGVSEQIVQRLQSQSGHDDLRVRAWILGVALAGIAQASTDVAVLASVIAISEKIGASDNETSQAAAVGFEAAARVLAAVDDADFRKRWDVASAIGIIGAVLASSRLYQLDAARTSHALGIAATQAAGLAYNVSHPMGAIEVGKAAADAIEAALIAKHGFTSAAASIEGRRGLAALMAYRFDANYIVEGIGARWITAPQAKN